MHNNAFFPKGSATLGLSGLVCAALFFSACSDIEAVDELDCHQLNSEAALSGQDDWIDRCLPGCHIESEKQYYPPGASSVHSQCQVCMPQVNNRDWTWTCCDILWEAYAPGAWNPDNICQHCSLDAPLEWSARPNIAGYTCRDTECAAWGACPGECGWTTKERDCTEYLCDSAGNCNAHPFVDSTSCYAGDCSTAYTCGAWGPCQGNCGHSVRYRDCLGLQCVNNQCVDHQFQQMAECYAGNCQADSCGAWSACQGECGTGQRTRTCTEYGCSNNQCIVTKTYTQTSTCYAGSCPANDCGPWSDCPASCTPGTQSRTCSSYTCSNSTCIPTNVPESRPCNSYIGCEYYAVVTNQYGMGDSSSWTHHSNRFSVAISNNGSTTASISISRGGSIIQNVSVPGNSVRTVALPWIDALVGATGSRLVTDGAYHIVSDQPVTVYQYNYYDSNVTNDASLLLPVTSWGTEVYAASWPNWTWSGGNHFRGFVAVVASENNTQVTLHGGKFNISPTSSIDSSGSGTVTMSKGDVLQVLTGGVNADLTGIRITANRPIKVIGGHECTQVPIGTVACDHLEQVIYPASTAGTEYVIAPPALVPHYPALKAQVVRIIATQNNTSIQYSPHLQGAPSHIASAGSFIELPQSTRAYKINATEPVIVVQYMVGQGADNGLADPAMLLAVPTDRFRSNYLFHAPTSWVQNWVDIIGPTGTSVQLNGTTVGGWSAIGSTGYSVTRHRLSNTGDGNHRITASQPVSISVYGVMSYGSYWYAGGLDLSN